MICTAWIPLQNTSKHNGGMGMVRKSQQKGILGEHFCCRNGLWYIEMDETTIEKTFECKMSDNEFECQVPYGGVLLFSNAIVHCSYTNVSPQIRWSMDFRWQASSNFHRIDELDSLYTYLIPYVPNLEPENAQWSTRT